MDCIQESEEEPKRAQVAAYTSTLRDPGALLFESRTARICPPRAAPSGLLSARPSRASQRTHPRRSFIDSLSLISSPLARYLSLSRTRASSSLSVGCLAGLYIEVHPLLSVVTADLRRHLPLRSFLPVSPAPSSPTTSLHPVHLPDMGIASLRTCLATPELDGHLGAPF